MVEKQVSNLSVVILALIIIIINEPLISIVVGGAGIIMLMVIFLVFNFRRYINDGKANSSAVLLVTLYLIFEIVYELLGISESSLIYYYYTISFFFFAFAITPILPKLTRRQQNALIVVIVVSIFIAMLTNIQLSNQYGEYYIRLTDYYNGYTNVVNTQYISSLVIFCGLLLIKARLSNEFKLVSYAMLFFSIYFIIAVGQRLTAIILLIFVLLFQTMYLGEKRRWRYVAYIIAIVMAIILVVNYEPILLWISDLINNDRVTVRINQLLYAFKFGEIQGAGGSLEVRFELMMNSLNTFKSSILSFFFGVGEHRTSNDLIGHHSQWIDQTAKYGVFGCVLIFFTLKKCFKDLKGALGLKKGRLLYHQYIIFISYFVIRGMIGYVIYPYFGVMIFVFLPLVFMQINEKNSFSSGGSL